MIAEHEFVTTFEEEAALVASSELLAKMGFRVKRDEGRVIAKRGAEKPGKAMRERQLPQRVEMTFDRGRCQLAASIQHAGKPKSLHRELIKAPLTTLEGVLVHGLSDEEALEVWRLADNRAGVRTTNSTGSRIVLWVLLGFLGLMLLGCIGGMLSAM